MRNPLPGVRIPMKGSASFGYQRTPGHVHQGVDLFVEIGRPIEATAAGVVTHASTVLAKGFSGYGRHVVVKTDDGVWQLHAHMDEVHVARGQRVEVGDVIGTVGDTCFRYPKSGREYFSETSVERCDDPQLHFEISPNPYPQKSEAPRLNAARWIAEDPHPSLIEEARGRLRRARKTRQKKRPARKGAAPPAAPFGRSLPSSFWADSRRSRSSWDYPSERVGRP